MTDRRQGQDPCPLRIFKDVGTAFMMGSIGGSIWHGVIGWRHRPRVGRIKVGMNFVHRRLLQRAPKVGVSFAAWMGLYSFFECIISARRGGSNAWSSIGAGGLTGMVLQLRKGKKRMARGFWFGAALMRV